MNAFRVYLVLVVLVIAVYTAVVIGDHGWNLFAVFFGDMAELNWPGQFNLDFMFMLLFSGFWIAWRQQFSPGGLALGVLGVFGGAPLLSIYLLVASAKAKGDVKELLLGPGRV